MTAVAALAMMVGLLAGVEPKLAIAASLSIGFVLIVLSDLTAGLAIFGFFSFLELLNLGSAISVSKLGGVLLALGWIAFVLTRKDAKSDFMTVHPAVSLVLGLFLGWVALSGLWAESTSLVVTAFARYLLNVILFLIVFSAVRDRRAATIVITGFLAGAVAAGAYGLLFEGAAVTAYEGRLTGTDLDPNQLASVLIAGMALSVGLAVGQKGKPGAQLITLGAGSRGGIVALAAMLLAAIVLGGRWRPRVAVLSILAALLAVFYIGALAPAAIRDRIKTTTETQQTNVEGRATLWKVGQRMVRAHPLNGVGADNFQTSSRHYLLQPGAVYRSDVIILTPQVAHNTYLQIAAELGLVGLFLFGTIVVFSVGCLVRAAGNFGGRGDVKGEALTRAVAVALIGVLVADFFISQEFNKQLWLLLGIGPAMLAISRRSASASARP